MNKRLYVVRHGKSDWSHPVSDYRRPLSPRGIREATRLGEWLAANHPRPDLLISSPAERARHTTQLLQETQDLPETLIEFDEGLYMADSHTLLETIQETPADIGTLMLVGHNPGMEELLVRLAGKAVPSAGLVKVLPTASMASLLFNCDWKDASPEHCTLEFSARGKAL